MFSVFKSLWHLRTNGPCGFNLKCIIDFSLVMLSFKSQAMLDTIYKEFELFKGT